MAYKKLDIKSIGLGRRPLVNDSDYDYINDYDRYSTYGNKPGDKVASKLTDIDDEFALVGNRFGSGYTFYTTDLTCQLSCYPKFKRVEKKKELIILGKSTKLKTR